MMTTDVDAVFVDTNVLVHANSRPSPLHAIAVEAMEFYASRGAEIWISRQILREYMAVVTRQQVFGGAHRLRAVLARVHEFESIFRVADETAETTRRLAQILAEVPAGGRQIHDANIVATMLCNGLTTLLTDTVADFRRFAGFVRVLPLQR